jgi:hypothetical protein
VGCSGSNQGRGGHAIDEKSVRECAQQHVSVFGECPEETSMEVNEKHLTKEELAEFQSAKAIEVTAFLAAKAFEALPPDLKPDMSQVVKMRWVLALENTIFTKRAKARAVLLGFQDPKYSERATS